MTDKKKMARKGKEIALQREIETQEDWEDMLSKEGLCVIDIYQGWCGHCSGMTAVFKKIKNELTDDLLCFFTAKSDTIDALEKYRGRCEPCFLFFAGGVLVAVIRGANAPLILRTITEQLAQEHKVIDGQAERKEIKDTMIAKLEEQDKQKEDEEAEEEGGSPAGQKGGQKEQKKEVSVVIIKPDAVQSGKAEEIMEEMKKRGIEILREERRQLTDEEVKNVYIHLQDESYFDDLVAFMTSAESIVLAITKGKTGENIIQEFRELIGPTDTEEAKEKAPESLRAKFGSDKYMNAVHGSDSSDTAARELAFFFPDFVAPEVDGAPKIQRTLALIRPDAYKNNKEQILAKIRESGFKVAMQKEIQLTKAEAEEFYKEHEGQDYFGELTDRMSSGPLLALGLAREDAVSGWRQMLGPTLVDDAKEKEPDSLRAQFAEEGAKVNMLHGSDSEERAQKEIEYFFPMEQTLAVIKPDAYQTKDEIIEKIHESGFRIAARKETTLSREIAEQFYADHQGKEFYNELVDHMCSGPTYFMVLSREGAVDGWRSLIGPTDPTQAKESHPDTLRGMYGQDPLRNAVHGSSNKEHAMQNIEKIFEDKEVKKLVGSSKTKTAVESSPIDKGAPVQESQPNETPSSNDPAEEASGVPDVVVHEVPSLNPDHLEEAIAEQQDITYETAPENINSEEKPSSPKPEEKKEEEQGPQQQEETKPTEQEPTQQEQSEAQEEKQEEEAQPAPEAAPEPTPEAGQEKAETEEKPKTPEAQAQEPEATPSEQTQAEPEKQPEQAEAKPADEQKEESKPDDPKPEETKPEETKPEETKPEETPKEEQTEAKPEAQAETTEEKKDEATAEQKEESKPDEQKSAEGEAQQTA